MTLLMGTQRGFFLKGDIRPQPMVSHDALSLPRVKLKNKRVKIWFSNPCYNLNKTTQITHVISPIFSYLKMDYVFLNCLHKGNFLLILILELLHQTRF